MLWAIGTILLHFQAVPQAVVPAPADRPAASSISEPAASTARRPQAAPAAERLMLAGKSASDEVTAFQPGQLALTPAVSTETAAAAAAPASPAMAPIIAESLSKPGFAARVSGSPQKLWLGLAIAQHSAATFDAWSTRRAITRSGAQELNPMLRPFASNRSIYAATQVGPALLDLLGHRMMTSRHASLRHTWWLPQVLGTAASLAGGMHNLRVH
jgi:hypothetical protein